MGPVTDECVSKPRRTLGETSENVTILVVSKGLCHRFSVQFPSRILGLTDEYPSRGTVQGIVIAYVTQIILICQIFGSLDRSAKEDLRLSHGKFPSVYDLYTILFR